jgi:hypothetical protein
LFCFIWILRLREVQDLKRYLWVAISKGKNDKPREICFWFKVKKLREVNNDSYERNQDINIILKWYPKER